MREDYMTRGLHPTSEGKRRLVNLTAEKMGNNHLTGLSSITAITNIGASPSSA
jgi:hypothetical protein